MGHGFHSKLLNYRRIPSFNPCPYTLIKFIRILANYSSYPQFVGATVSNMFQAYRAIILVAYKLYAVHTDRFRWKIDAVRCSITTTGPWVQKKSTSTVCRSFKLGPPVKDIFTQVGGNEGTMIHDNTENYWLVVWNMNFIFPFHIWECHHPNWSELHHFSEA